jgi:hypothetical protein
MSRLDPSTRDQIRRVIGVKRKGPVVTGDSAIDLVTKLHAVQKVTGVDNRWVVFGWIANNFVESGNYFPPDGSAFERWRQGSDIDLSSAKCLVPKPTGKQPDTRDGYVTFDIPAMWRDVVVAAKREYTLPNKIAAHRIVCALSSLPPQSVPDAIYEVSHYCGNPFCIKHVGWETKSINQSRANCWKYGTELERHTVCNGHGSQPTVYCVRRRDCVVPTQVLLAMSGGDGMDARSDIVASIIREYLALSSADQALYAEWYREVVKAGRGVSSLMKFFKSVFTRSLVRQEYMAEFDRLSGLARASDKSAFVAEVGDKYSTPSPAPPARR